MSVYAYITRTHLHGVGFAVHGNDNSSTQFVIDGANSLPLIWEERGRPN